MGATRKLQGEIDRVLKKVQEGVDVFDSIWNKVYDTENANQKEKFEADLKKEIKKLQRYRDQIKTWIQSSEIKDKKALLDARKLIEREMERFKVCEKETKTKAFSKEGLGQQPKTDPREKAKGESRDWLNNMVSELESQIDSFEAETEGLQVKKGKSRPPRLNHLEESIARNKKHIGKLEATLRLLDNDEVSPDQVNDIKDLVEDYVERNQESFDEFEDVEQVYETLPLDNIEDPTTLDAINIVIPPVVIKAGSLVMSPNGSKPALLSPGSQPLGPPAVQLPEEVVVPEDSGTQTPPPVLHTQATVTSPSQISLPGIVIGSSVASSTPSTPTAILRGPSSVVTSTAAPSRLAVKPASVPIQAPMSIVVKSKDEERTLLVDRRVGSGLGDLEISRPQAVSRIPSLGSSAPLMPLTLGGIASNSMVMPSNSLGSHSLLSDLSKRTGDDRFGSGGLAQQLAGSLGSQNRAFLQPGTKVLDGNIVGDGAVTGDGGLGSGRMNYSNSTWRQHSASPFQNQTDAGQFHSRTKIAPDQKQEYVQRFHNQQGLSATAVQQLSQFCNAGQNKQQLHPSQQLLQLLQHQQQQHHQQGSSLVQAASLQHQQAGLSSVQASQASSVSVQAPKPLVTESLQVVNAQNPPQLVQQLSLGSSTVLKENDLGRISEQQPQQQQGQHQELSDDGNNDVSSLGTGFARNVSLSDEDLKNSDTFNVSISGPGTLAELSQLSRDADFTPGQPMQTVQSSAPNLGVIGRRGTELGAIGDNISNHDQFHNLQMLEAAYRNIPQLKDSERPRSYIPKNRVNVPGSYPQTPAPILDNPALWERLDTDVLFFAFYYQQETYHQYLAARELKKQSWRYHKKYNTWFQRHEEPKVTTDEYEQGTYVYFDFNIMHGDSSQGWCQRIKTEFTFEYSYLEDELYV